jgi:NAD(P)-dependent dehydrogenase (short-subunit alcohol dehydrogenase family)
MSDGSILAGGLEGYTALVTGGGSGIGLGCARRFVRDGASVMLCGRTEERLVSAVHELERDTTADARVGYSVADVTNEDQVAAAVRAGADISGSGTLDAVVACAGGSETIGPMTQTDTDAWRRTIDLNITGTMLTIKHAGRLMARAGHGSIVGISSIASTNTHRWFGAYGPGKAGIDHLCMVAADELGASGVRVNSIRPGLVDTELVAFITAGGPVLDDYLACMPISRVGTVDDVAAMARFLVGPESTWITGQCIGVDGGHHLRRGPDYGPMLVDAFGADALRGIVDDPDPT